MNKFIYLLTAVSAALLLTSCNSSYFTTANNMRNMYGTVYMLDGRQLRGEITVSLENSFGGRDYIQFSEKGGRERQKLYVADIQGFMLNNDVYEPKKVDLGWLNSDRLLFLKRLTRDGSRIHLYELMRQRNETDNYGRRYNRTEFTFYITLPQHDRLTAWSLDGRNLVPNFEDKMSKYVEDCPKLAEKIKRKDKGYFYAQVSLFDRKRVETILNIIDEYNECK